MNQVLSPQAVPQPRTEWWRRARLLGTNFLVRRIAKALFTIFFVVFFSVSVAYYVRTAVFVDSKGVTFRGLVRTQRFQFSDIRKVDILPGPVTVYSVRANGRFGHFTSFFKHHRMLLELLVERAGLAPRRAGFL